MLRFLIEVFEGFRFNMVSSKIGLLSSLASLYSDFRGFVSKTRSLSSLLLVMACTCF